MTLLKLISEVRSLDKNFPMQVSGRDNCIQKFQRLWIQDFSQTLCSSWYNVRIHLTVHAMRNTRLSKTGVTFWKAPPIVSLLGDFTGSYKQSCKFTKSCKISCNISSRGGGDIFRKWYTRLQLAVLIEL